MTRSDDLDRQYLPGFERRLIDGGDGPVNTLIGGDGPPVLMLHGDPQTHLCWHAIAPALAEQYTVVLTDLRGRGDSHKPGSAAPGDDNAYRKRTMAAEQHRVMRELGFDCFRLVGHDRGARVASRLALDFPDAVERLAVLDIVPILDFYAQTTAEIAQDYFYFFFLTQPAPLPERLIAGDPESFMADILDLSPAGTWPDALREHYLQAAAQPAAIAAMCDCFRAGRQIDMEDDRQDRETGRKIACPTLVLWGEHGVVGRYFDMPEIWSRWAGDVPLFAPLPANHFLPEEVPDLVTAHLLEFLT